MFAVKWIQKISGSYNGMKINTSLLLPKIGSQQRINGDDAKSNVAPLFIIVFMPLFYDSMNIKYKSKKKMHLKKNTIISSTLNSSNK